MIVYGGVDANSGRCQGQVLIFDTGKHTQYDIPIPFYCYSPAFLTDAIIHSETHTWTTPLLPGAHPLPLVGHTANLIEEKGRQLLLLY